MQNQKTDFKNSTFWLIGAFCKLHTTWRYEFECRQNKDPHNLHSSSARNKVWRTANTEPQLCLHTAVLPKATVWKSARLTFIPGVTQLILVEIQLGWVCFNRGRQSCLSRVKSVYCSWEKSRYQPAAQELVMLCFFHVKMQTIPNNWLTHTASCPAVGWFPALTLSGYISPHAKQE